MSDLPFTLTPETADDEDAILRLNERVFGPGRFARTAYRLRETTAARSVAELRRPRRDAAGRRQRDDADLDRRDAGAAAGAADRRAGVPQPRHRRGAGQRLAGGGAGGRGAAGRFWSATSPITAAWGSSRRRRGASCCPARSIRRACCMCELRRARSRASPASCAGRRRGAGDDLPTRRAGLRSAALSAARPARSGVWRCRRCLQPAARTCVGPPLTTHALQPAEFVEMDDRPLAGSGNHRRGDGQAGRGEVDGLRQGCSLASGSRNCPRRSTRRRWS